MKAERKKETKLKLDDIPKAGTAGRNILVVALMELKEYKKALSEGFSYFSEEELHAIEQKYTAGMLREDMQNELKKKRWQLNINTIKHYIKVGQLPKATCCKTEGKTMYFYPPEFMRHLNLVRFLLTTGKKSDSFAAVVKVMANVKYRDDVLLDEHDEECYKEYSYGFLNLIYAGIERICDGVYFGEKAVKAAFSKNNEKKNKYLKLLDKIDHLVDEISKEADTFRRESENST
ncbi:MAG: hypothetical protein HW390_3146 [Candidatus Brocadiaceae bacterium]|nr:hypothetical protein [Candidatus Brocadiaceae bacterium]